MLGLFNRNSEEFLCRFVVVDETRIHWHAPYTKEQSKQWGFPGEHVSQKTKTVPYAEKVMASVSWDAQGVIHIDYLARIYLVNSTLI